MLSKFDAQVVIDNVRDDIQRGFNAGSVRLKKKNIRTSSGSEVFYNDLIDGYLHEYDVSVVGSALEIVRKSFNFTNPALYYASKDSDTVSYQDEQEKKFEKEMDDFIEKFMKELEDEEEEPDEPAKDPDTMTEQDVEEYNRLRRKWQNKKRYLNSKGVNIGELPSIVTRGIRSLEDVARLNSFIDLANKFLSGGL